MSLLHETGRATRMVRVWDVPTRVFHWCLVAMIAFAWVSFRYSEALGDPMLRWHRANGYAILILVVFRLLWGVVGSSTSRFCGFVRWPWRALGYGIDMLRGRPRHFLGHNPLGSYMVLALLAGVATQGVLGLFTLEHNEMVAGPLKRYLSEDGVKLASSWHRRGFNLLLVLVALHVVANLTYQLFKRDPLITAMITGRKPEAAYEDEAEAQIAPTVAIRALTCLALAAAIVLGGIWVASGKLL